MGSVTATGPGVGEAVLISRKLLKTAGLGLFAAGGWLGFGQRRREQIGEPYDGPKAELISEL